MGKRRSIGDDTSNDCELKAMLIDECKMCHANSDTDHHKTFCRNKSDRDDGENLSNIFSAIKLLIFAMTLECQFINKIN